MVGIPVKMMLLLCIVVLTHATISLKTSHTSKTIHRADLPQQVVLSEKKLASIKAKLQLQFEERKGKLRKSEMNRLMDELRDIQKSRKKESAFCCKLDAEETIRLPTLVGYTVSVKISVGGSTNCGLGGWSRCGTSREQYVAVMRYKEVFNKTLTIPSTSQWDSGCYQNIIECCRCYFYREGAENCLSLPEYERLFQLQFSFCHWDLNLIEGFTPLPSEIPCPDVNSILENVPSKYETDCI